MDRIADNWKKYPLLVIGAIPAPLPGAISYPAEAIGTPDSLPIHDFYVIVAVAPAQVEATLARLEQIRLSPAQIIVFLPTEIPFSHPHKGFMGVIDGIEGQNAEDFRIRMLSKLESQRQKKLCYALQEAMDNGLPRRRSEAELARALDACRIAHTLACGYALSPLLHARVLRMSLEKEATNPDPWPNDISPERLIVETAVLLLDCFHKGAGFRELLKEKSAALPFRARNDLLHHIETCLAFLTGAGGRSNAA